MQLTYHANHVHQDVKHAKTIQSAENVTKIIIWTVQTIVFHALEIVYNVLTNQHV